jgi:hypothetical protein
MLGIFHSIQKVIALAVLASLAIDFISMLVGNKKKK